MKTSSIPAKPSFIYFDLGGVIVRDFSASHKWLDLLRELGVPEGDERLFRRLWAQYVEPRMCLDYNVDDFMSILECKMGLPHRDEYSLMRDGFVARFHENKSIQAVLSSISAQTPVGLLTNMYPGMLDQIIARGILPLAVPWREIIDSSEVGARKPDSAIFELATQRAGVPEHKILFVDNAEENIAAAMHYGWQAYWYDSTDYERSSQQLSEYLRELMP